MILFFRHLVDYSSPIATYSPPPTRIAPSLASHGAVCITWQEEPHRCFNTTASPAKKSLTWCFHMRRPSFGLAPLQGAWVLHSRTGGSRWSVMAHGPMVSHLCLLVPWHSSSIVMGGSKPDMGEHTYYARESAKTLGMRILCSVPVMTGYFMPR